MGKFLLTFFALFLTLLQASYAADMRFIQVDGVLFDSQSSEKFEQLIDKINKEKNVSFVVFSGDNIAKPNKKILEEFLSSAKKLKAPFYIVLGNKDVNRYKDLSKKTYFEVLQKKLKRYKKITSPNYVFKNNGLIFVVMDGSKEVIPSNIGYYKDESLAWLEEQLEIYQDNNVIILQHFPVISPISKEGYNTYNPEKYLNLLLEYNNVKAVIAGHFNVNSEQENKGVLHITTKSAPNYRIIDIMNYETSKPTFWSTIKE